MMITKLIKIAKKLSIQQLVGIPFIIGFVLMIIMFVLFKIGITQTGIRNFLFMLVFFIWGCAGLAIVIRKEAPPPWNSKGGVAVIEGIVILVSCWGVALLIVIEMFKNIFK